MQQIWRALVTTVFILMFTTVFSQKYSKVKVNLTGRDVMELAKAGLETDHGIFVKNRYFVNDFSESEIALIKRIGFETEILIDDVIAFYALDDRPSAFENLNQRSINCSGSVVQEYQYNTPKNYRAGTMGDYFTYQDMLDILDTMAMKYPNLITVRQPIDTIKTYGGRSIYFVKVSDNILTDDTNEPKVLYTALHHAREPNSLSQMIFYLWYLLENYETDPIVKKIVDETVMYFIPCINPDGYVQNQTTHPNGGGLWRKNMWRNAANELKGVDLNRNYGYFWGNDNIGSSDNPNSAVYRGESAFSEPETRAVRSFCTQHDFKIAQNYHTFGNYLVHPWGYNDQPTSEDKLFKSMGRVMNQENNFKMGTGTETVGYVVNGDADDWMYGATDEKNAIYSYTPEVGPSFWPAKVDIDYLNKSCVWMNMATALVTLNYYAAEEVPSSPYLTSTDNILRVRMTRSGLMDGSCTIKLQSNVSGVEIKNPTKVLSLDAGKSELVDFEIVYAQPLDEEEIQFELITEMDGLKRSLNISRVWLNQDFETVLEEAVDRTSNFINNGWDLTSESFLSPPYSMSDSPGALYPNKHFATVTLKEPFDLSNSNHALLTFFAKWDVEEDYDYVQVLASDDNIDYIPLCGKYSNFGTNQQQFGSPLYDGTQLEWVKEEIDLDQFVGSTEVWIRFLIKTDDFEQRDGFYFDDLELKVNKRVVTEVVDVHPLFKIYPSLTDGSEPIFIHDLANTQARDRMIITDIFGRTVAQVSIENGMIDIKNLHLAKGMYLCKMESYENVNQVAKLVIH